MGEPIIIEFKAEERQLLRHGLLAWNGPADCTEEFAVAMGFAGISNLLSESTRLSAAIVGGEALSAFDWERSLIATEVLVGCDLVGVVGPDWELTTAFSPEQTTELLGAIRARVRDALGPRSASVVGTRGIYRQLDAERTATAAFTVDQQAIRFQALSVFEALVRSDSSAVDRSTLATVNRAARSIAMTADRADGPGSQLLRHAEAASVARLVGFLDCLDREARYSAPASCAWWPRTVGAAAEIVAQMRRSDENSRAL